MAITSGFSGQETNIASTMLIRAPNWIREQALKNRET